MTYSAVAYSSIQVSLPRWLLLRLTGRLPRSFAAVTFNIYVSSGLQHSSWNCCPGPSFVCRGTTHRCRVTSLVRCRWLKVIVRPAFIAVSPCGRSQVWRWCRYVKVPRWNRAVAGSLCVADPRRAFTPLPPLGRYIHFRPMAFVTMRLRKVSSDDPVHLLDASEDPEGISRYQWNERSVNAVIKRSKS